MARPLSPGGRTLLRAALDAVGEAVAVLAKGAASCGGVVDTLGTATDSLAYRRGPRARPSAAPRSLPCAAWHQRWLVC